MIDRHMAVYGFIKSHETRVWLLAYLFIAVLASRSILLKERDPSYKASWLAIVWLSPFLGVFFYLILGINRVARKGQKIRRKKMFISDLNTLKKRDEIHPGLFDIEKDAIAQTSQNFVKSIYKLTDCPLVTADSLEVLQGGEKAYESMLDSIEKACISVHLQSYIFDRGKVGDLFIAALTKAKQRGVDVRILIDAIGAKYSFPSSYSQMKKIGLNCFKFLPNRLSGGLAFINLRNHRKILTVDASLAFTGGMNIRDTHLQSRLGAPFTDDLHFKLTGPVVQRLDSIFMEDWCFSGGILANANHFFESEKQMTLNNHEQYVCRVIPDGPDIPVNKINLTNVLAISFAKSSIDILTPYFLPDKTTIDALCIAAMKGVLVRILLPKKGNISFVNWAMRPQFSSLINSGCQIFLSDFVFDHSKLMIMDRSWVCIGSANWDMRSYRLNFEVNIEVYNLNFAVTMCEVFEQKILLSNRLTSSDVAKKTNLSNLRDQMFSLVSPYL